MSFLMFMTSAGAFAGTPARESWVPVVGRVTTSTRAFYSTLFVANPSVRAADVTLSFFSEAHPSATPRVISVQVGGRGNAAVDIDERLVGTTGATGSLRIMATEPVVATVRIFSRAVNDTLGAGAGITLNAVPAQYALGSGETTSLRVPEGVRYKLYAAETHGFPLYFSVRTMSPTHSSERRLYLGPDEQRSWDLRRLFPDDTSGAILLTGINGSGKIVAAGTATTAITQEMSVFEMPLADVPRHRLRWPEISAYIAASLALAMAALYRMKTHR